ncbi:Thioesterase-like superfamily protein [Nonomuraea solani]|uniref:Thioesterase-like superfamily protein n=1 Tax=Nonomuraea solani TaxID=1144553 RepID=A0A1H6A1C3_9ACTN|nr:thioesterase family protein [Nonomuraea solani]SEG42152.1 Thioesterase-like superfamily protein [Nonomuraea solani]
MAMYSRIGEGRYLASEHTQGPWDPGTQHMGPVTALIAHELALTAPRPGLEPSRLVVDVFAPVPLAELQVTTEVARDGKRVQCLTASVSSGGREYVRASAWRIRAAATPPTPVPGPPAPIPPPSEEHRRSWLGSGFGYGKVLDWRFVTGGPLRLGPATVWGRLTTPLVEGEELTPMEGLAAFADSGNGVSMALDFDAYVFANVDLTISLFRAPAGEWFCMDATTVIGPGGRGLTRSTLYDETGELGTATQTLFVTPR